ncbi:MAG: radical SAM protein, partial [Clostridia bacterium]
MNGKTIRIALDPKKPITELSYPEFYDIAVSKKCFGNCSFCYQDSTPESIEPENIIEKVRNFFKTFTRNQLPFQIAYGGGEVFTHKEFLELLKVTKDELDIVPNYTTNGMWSFEEQKKVKEILYVTKTYCGGVAVSTHPHLEKYWRKAVTLYLENNIFTNLHVI